MELSTRLQAVADFVTAGYKLADIGTDHAYIPIALVEQNRIPGAIAMDINEGPLQRAGEHIAENKMEKKIEIRLSNGFSALKKGEAESAVIAGMGGGLMIRILTEGEQIAKSLKECILQPQSEIERVRRFLLEEGYVKGVQVIDDDKQGVIRITLKYTETGAPVISGLRRVSKPGLRIYSNCEDMPKVMKGLGTAIISTSKGVMTDKSARRENVGGEVLAFVW